MTDYSPKKEGYDKKTLSDKQTKLLKYLAESEDGDAIAAAVKAGYSNPYQAVKQNAEHIKQLVDDELVKLSFESVKVLGKILRSSAGVPQAGEKTRVAITVLERTHPKTEKVDVSGEVKGGIFILPNKKPLDEAPNEQD